MSNKCTHCGKKISVLSTHLYKGEYLCIDCLTVAKHDRQYDFLEAIPNFTVTKKYVNELKQEGILVDDIRNEFAIISYKPAILNSLEKVEEINRRVLEDNLSISDAKEIVESEQREYIKNKSKYKLEYDVFPFNKLLEIEIIEDGKSINRKTRDYLADEKLMKEIHYGEIKDYLGFPVSKDKGEDIAGQLGLKIVVYSLVKAVFYVDFFNKPGSELSKKSPEYISIVENIKFWFDIFEDIIHTNNIADKDALRTTKINTTTDYDFYDVLKKLAKLKSEGIITEEEFASKKAAILSKL